MTSRIKAQDPNGVYVYKMTALLVMAACLTMVACGATGHVAPHSHQQKHETTVLTTDGTYRTKTCTGRWMDLPAGSFPAAPGIGAPHPGSGVLAVRSRAQIACE